MRLHIHRGFFAKALAECPDDPLRSRYYESTLAAFRAALHICAATRYFGDHAPLSSRMPYMFSAAFHSMVSRAGAHLCAALIPGQAILVTLVIKSPRCQLAPTAWLEFEATLKTLEEFACTFRRVQAFLVRINNVAFEY